jgi:hypothetical protein
MPVESRELCARGAEAAEDVLRCVFRIEKALDPLDPRDFIVLIGRLSAALRGVAGPAEEAALRRAIERLDVDWPHLSPQARNQVIRAARQALRTVEGQVLPQVEQLFTTESERLVGRTRKSAVRRLGLRISADLTRTDERIARFVRESQGHFIRDEYGRRRDAFSRRARDIVASGVERGLGRDDIVTELAAAMSAASLNRDRSYWEVISMVFANRARTFTQLGVFEEGGIERFRFEAVLDEVTSEVCRFMHGRVFSVGRAMERFRQVERARDPVLIRATQPFVQVGADSEGNQVLFYKRGGRRRSVARVDEPAVGERDRVGLYSRELSSEQLEAAGITTPPLHGRCRSTLVAEV